MFIHIKPEEAEAIQRIPRALLFPAPGRPKGHLLMGYDGEGRCPMLAGDECSIYEHRPQTCRDYEASAAEDLRAGRGVQVVGLDLKNGIVLATKVTVYEGNRPVRMGNRPAILPDGQILR